MHYITMHNYGNTKRQSNSTDMALETVKDIAKDVTSILQKINGPSELLLRTILLTGRMRMRVNSLS